MFLGTITNWTSVAETTIPFVTKLNTNNKIANAGGVISLNKPGIWNIDSSISVSGVASAVTLSVLADGTPTGATAVVTPATTSQSLNMSIVDAVKSVYAQYPNVANVTLELDTAGLTVNGDLRIEYVC